VGDKPKTIPAVRGWRRRDEFVKRDAEITLTKASIRRNDNRAEVLIERENQQVDVRIQSMKLEKVLAAKRRQFDLL